MNNQSIQHRSISNQLPFSISVVAVRPGRGQAAFFCDVRFEDWLTITDFPVWRGKGSDLQPGFPSKPGENGGDRRALLRGVKPELVQEIFRSILVACRAVRR